MDQKRMACEQVCEEVQKLVEAIQSYDGSSGHAEKAWREDQQYLLRLLSEYPLDVHKLDEQLKEKVKEIVDGYINWSFNAYW